MRWLTTPPWPYALTDAEWFIGDSTSVGAMVIECAGQVAGIVSINADGDLGYWLARAFHGHGYMTEAAGTLVARHFASGGGDLTSGYLLGNGPSCNVLTKIGFSNNHVERSPSRPLNADVDIQRMVLTSAAYHAALQWEARSARLTCRPMQAADADALHTLHSDWAIVRQLGSWPWPPEHDFVTLRARPYGGDGFVWGVFLAGKLVGTFGFTDGVIGYSLTQDLWGQGFGTELLATGLDHGFRNHPRAEVTASVWCDNPASQALLRRMGFRWVEQTVEMSKARKVEVGLEHFTLTHADWLARQPAGSA